ncbi:hypothetical protein P7C70_g699, partial [Phenoliferia sp. Uapishka_3]
MLYATPLFLTFFATLACTQSLPTQEALAAYLDTSAIDTTSIVQGETLDLSPFSLSVLTNESHALISFNISKKIGEIGYVACGFGSSMADSSMVILWPSTDSNWTISHRSASGHNMPRISSGSGTATPPFIVVAELTVATSISTSVTFLRPLTLPSNQSLFDKSGYLNMSRTENAQRMMFAYTKNRPSSVNEDAIVYQHDSGKFGSKTVDLTKAFVGSSAVGWTKFDTVVVIHGTQRPLELDLCKFTDTCGLV